MGFHSDPMVEIKWWCGFTTCHYYRIGICSRSFVPVTFGPGTKGGFCPGSKGAGGHRLFVPGGATNRDKRPPFCPGWWLHPGQKGPTFLSRLVTPTRTKRWPFYPGWWYQPGQKDSFVPVGVTNPDKRPLHVIVQKGVILYWVTCTT